MKKILKKVFKKILTFRNHNIWKYSRSYVSISKKAIINSGDLLKFNYNPSTKKYAKIGFLKIDDGAIFSFGKKCLIFDGAHIELFKNAKFIIGDNTYLCSNCFVSCHSLIKIGNDCAISHNFSIRDCDMHFIDNKENLKEINIGNHVWIGQNVTILKGVTIGDNCVIGANAVVTRSIPNNCLAVGNPAKIIRNNIEWH